MENLYFALVDTPGFFAEIIRKFTKCRYIHVVLGVDAYLEEAYSVGRRNPAIPIISGFEKENLQKIADKFPTAEYQVFSIPCTSEQKKAIIEELQECHRRRFHYHYAILGLPFILLQKPFYQKNHYTCSSYISKLLMKHGVCQFDKHFSLVTPKDFYDVAGSVMIFEGNINSLLLKRRKTADTFYWLHERQFG